MSPVPLPRDGSKEYLMIVLSLLMNPLKDRNEDAQ
jgi:hypothetical protein